MNVAQGELLVPLDAVPSAIILGMHSEPGMLDLFPVSANRDECILGNYTIAPNPERRFLSPLEEYIKLSNAVAISSLDSHQYQSKRRIESGENIQLELVRRIDSAVINLTENGWNIAEAERIINTYVREQNIKVAKSHSQQLNRAQQQAAELRAFETADITSNNRPYTLNDKGQFVPKPTIPLKELKNSINQAVIEQRRIRAKQERLRFEWMSALAILMSLDHLARSYWPDNVRRSV